MSIEEQAPTSSTNARKSPQTICQKLGVPFLLWLMCIPVTFVAVYTTAWFGGRFHPDIQGTHNWIINGKVDSLFRRLNDYRNDFNKYPLTLIHLYAKVAPDQNVTEDKANEVAENIDRDTWVTCSRWSKKWMKLQYQSDGEAFSISHYGMDGEKGGVGINTDVTFTSEDFKNGSVVHNAVLTAPTFRQFLFEMDTSPAILKSCLYINLFLLFALAMQSSRHSTKINVRQTLMYILVLIPICSMVAIFLTAFYFASTNSGH